MANYSNLEMGVAISNHPHIIIKKSLFGLRKQLVYQPTQSPIDVVINDYDAENGALIERVLRASTENLSKVVEAVGKVKATPIANIRLEACLSRDHQFVALQLFRFVDFKYQPLTDMHCYEGPSASLVAQVL